MAEESSSKENWNDEEKWHFLVRHERIGELLVRAGKLSLGQLDSLLKEQEGSSKHLGEIIVEKKLLSLDEIISALDRQKEARDTSKQAIRELKDHEKE